MCEIKRLGFSSIESMKRIKGWEHRPLRIGYRVNHKSFGTEQELDLRHRSAQALKDWIENREERIDIYGTATLTKNYSEETALKIFHEFWFKKVVRRYRQHAWVLYAYDRQPASGNPHFHFIVIFEDDTTQLHGNNKTIRTTEQISIELEQMWSSYGLGNKRQRGSCVIEPYNRELGGIIYNHRNHLEWGAKMYCPTSKQKYRARCKKMCCYNRDNHHKLITE